MTPTQKMFPLLERKTSAQDVICLPMTGAHIHVDNSLTKEHRFLKFVENVSVNFILRNHMRDMFSSYLVLLWPPPRYEGVKRGDSKTTRPTYVGAAELPD